MKRPSPHKWATLFLKWFCKPELWEHIQGDLEESFEELLPSEIEKVSKKQIRKAQWQYIIEVLLLFRPGIIRSFHLIHLPAMNLSILQNYVKMALRQIARHRLFSFLNIFGLSVSMAICLLVILIFVDQYSFDQFHEKKHSIYRVTSDRQSKGNAKPMNTATAPLPIATALDSLFPGVEKTVRIVNIWADVKSNKDIIPVEGKFVDPSFFDIFSFEWLKGNRQTALSGSGGIVLTQSCSKKLFGEEESMGQWVTLGDQGEYLVKGIVPDPPQRSHLQFDFLLSMGSLEQLEKEGKRNKLLHNWDNIWQAYVYVLLKKPFEKAYLDQSLSLIAKDKNNADEEIEFVFVSQEFTDIAPIKIGNNEMGMMLPEFVLWFFAALGGVIISLACVNYTNLSIARSLKRAKEIGLRKVLGAKRQQIFTQFIVEAILISMMALGLAVVLLEYLIPIFMNLSPFVQKFFGNRLRREPIVYAWFVAFSIIIGFIAGVLPALHLSAYKPVDTLKQLKNVKLLSYMGLRKFLIVIQFTFSLIFIMSTIILFQQQKLLLGINLGFKTDQIVNVELQGLEYEVFKQEVSKLSSVAEISGSAFIPSTGVNFSTCMSYMEDTLITRTLNNNIVSKNFIQNLQFELITGDNFPDYASSETEQYLILNESGVEKLGFSSPSEAVGRIIRINTCNELGDKEEGEGDLVEICGVMRDFAYVGVALSSWNNEAYGLRYAPSQLRHANVLLRGDQQDIQNGLEQLEAKWRELNPTHAFRYKFFDEQVAQQFVRFSMATSIIGFLGLLAIIISSLGLLGMVTFMVEGRIQEVSIRKILGANEPQLIWLLSKSFALLLSIAIFIGIPIAWLINSYWLEWYTQKVSINAGLIILSVGIVLLLSGIATISQAYIAARTNPADTLRND